MHHLGNKSQSVPVEAFTKMALNSSHMAKKEMNGCISGKQMDKYFYKRHRMLDTGSRYFDQLCYMTGNCYIDQHYLTGNCYIDQKFEYNEQTTLNETDYLYKREEECM